ncbi:MAG: FtsX-like permease family protein [Cyclobacteriaceae bacterium]
MKNEKTPKVFRYLRWFCPPQLLEEIEGDLMQRYERDLKPSDNLEVSKRLRRANRRLLWNTLQYFRPGIILRNKVYINSNPMLHNYLKVGSRNLLRHKAFSLINITGLVLGISCTALIMIWVQHEFSIDRSYPDSERIFKAWNRASINGEIQAWNTTPRILAPTLDKEYAEVEYAASFADWQNEFLFTKGSTKFTSNAGPVTETSFLKIFNLPFISGNPNTALDDPFSMVLTEQFSKKLFGDTPALGESVHVKFEGNDLDFKVTGIIKDLPGNSSFNFDYLISWELFKAFGEEDTYWGNNSVETFVKLRSGTSLELFNRKIGDIEIRHSNGEHTNEIFLYPVVREHLYSEFTNGIPDGGRIEIVSLVIVVAVFILIISCINFVNLSTARSDHRTKEVGIRKTIGAGKANLISQFLTESVLVALVSGLISLLVIYLALPYFSQLTGTQMTIDLTTDHFWIGLFAIVLFCGVVAGAYPAFLLSSFQPSRTLRGPSNSSMATLRQALVVFQFGFAIVLIVATLVVRDQITFAQKRNSGYNMGNLIYFPLNGDLSQKYWSFKDELLQSGAAVSVTRTFSPLTQIWSSTDRLEWQGKDPDARIDFDRFTADADLVTTAGLDLILGRDLDLSLFPSDSAAALINETAMKAMNSDNPIGQTLKDGPNEFTIVGVFKDLVVRSPYRSARPMMVMGGNWFYTTHIRLNSSLSASEALLRADRVFKKYCPDYPFDFRFVDIEYQQKFNDEVRTGRFASVASAISILISCLGMLGLSIFMIEKRTKEIGIRKVFGAPAATIMSLLFKEPMRLIGIAFFIAAPVGYVLMEHWLQRFDYRTEVNLNVFLLTGLGAVIIAWTTISIQSLRAATRNPVETLRHD